MNTAFLLMAQYEGKAIIPVGDVVRDYFPDLTTEQFMRQALRGEIALPVIRMDPNSQKAAKFVHINDLAAFLDKEIKAATECAPIVVAFRAAREARVRQASPQPSETPAKVAHLYRHFDKAGKLLYIGVSLEALVRLRGHQATSHWSHQIHTITMETFESRPEAFKAETAAIAVEKPLHNIAKARKEPTK